MGPPNSEAGTPSNGATPPSNVKTPAGADAKASPSFTAPLFRLSAGATRTLRPSTRRSSVPCMPSLDLHTKLKIGVCAMEKKASAKPMKDILARITLFNEFEIVSFTDKTLLEDPVQLWPLCDCLLSWHSDGFPLKKAQEYVALRRPFCVNDVMQQDLLMDRRSVYKTLTDHQIPTPTHIIVSRDDLPEGVMDPPGFVEGNNWVELDGKRINKPFVEKPSSGEDHNVYIYYPSSMGGGVKRLFRKVDNKSSQYDSTHPGTVRREGSYIYEEFLTTGGTDVKVYTVGPRYAHAEARKSPVVDGKVQRSADGKELRFPVLLSPQEKQISRMVVLAFGQKICGFDLLRSERGRSFVCDVNGLSFVKNSKKYYDDAAGILRSIILYALAPNYFSAMPALPSPIPCQDEKASLLQPAESFQEMNGTGGTADGDDDDANVAREGNPQEELRCVLAVIRHGDRTPKQKMKMKVFKETPSLLALFDKYADSKGKQAKLKRPEELQDLLNVTRKLVGELEEELNLPPMDILATRTDQARAGEGEGEGKGTTTLLHSPPPPRCPPGITVPSEGEGGSSQPPSGKSETIDRVEAGSSRQLFGKSETSDRVEGGSSRQLFGKSETSDRVEGGSSKPPSGKSENSDRVEGGSSSHPRGKFGGDRQPSGKFGSDREGMEEMLSRLRIILMVLEAGGHFSGVNRKVQLKPTCWHTLSSATTSLETREGESYSSPFSTDSGMEGPESFAASMTNPSPSNGPGGVTGGVDMSGAKPPSRTSAESTSKEEATGGAVGVPPRGSVGDRGGMPRQFSMSAGGSDGKGASDNGRSSEGDVGHGPAMDLIKCAKVDRIIEELLLVLKWGGTLTHAGRKQAEELGSYFRFAMYPRYGPAGGGLLRLHSTYRHDLKIYSSDEGRVQMSAAAFTKGLLDLEGDSLTPILVSLVNKDASMLEAFGKGASEDMRISKEVLYQQLTWDPDNGRSLYSPLPQTLPAVPSPPPSPANWKSGQATPTKAFSALLPSHVLAWDRAPTITRTPSGGNSRLAQSSSAGGLGGHAESSEMPTNDVPAGPLLTPFGQGPPGPKIRGMPKYPLELLKKLADQLRLLVDALDVLKRRAEQSALTSQAAGAGGSRVLEAGGKSLSAVGQSAGGSSAPEAGGKSQSALGQSAEEWENDAGKDEAGKPCSGGMMLMHDRWKKLLHSFYSAKKGTFDISKVPDIYDSVKYDAIHNSHLNLPGLPEIYQCAKALADVVIPNEYGLLPEDKLSVGGKVCKELLGKLLSDMGNMREESIITAGSWEQQPADVGVRPDSMVTEFGRMSLEDENLLNKRRLLQNSAGQLHLPTTLERASSDQPALPTMPETCMLSPPPQDDYPRSLESLDMARRDSDAAMVVGNALMGMPGLMGPDVAEPSMHPVDEEPNDEGAEPLHRLCPTYASDINSPLRHVRTRIYFTSESHIHSLINVLRFCHLRPGSSDTPLISPECNALLEDTPEYDYLTHIVFRMYENKAVPVSAPERFRVELSLSPGAAHDPINTVPPDNDHTLSAVPRIQLNTGMAETLAMMEELLGPLSSSRRLTPSTFALQAAMSVPQTHA